MTVAASLLGPYQYKTRVARLRLKGAHVHEFGDRTLQQGSFGDDVMQLQAYLSEQGYLSSEDGLSGYMGEVTAQALQAWQRDHGVRASGVFDGESKWAYIKQQEATLQQATQAQAQAALTMRPPPLPAGWRMQAPPPGLATGALGLAALAAGLAMAQARRREGRPTPGLAELGSALRWALHSLAWAVTAMGRGATAAGDAAQQALEPGAAPPPRGRARGRSPPVAAAAAQPPAAAMFDADDRLAAGHFAPHLAARQSGAEHAAPLSGLPGSVPFDAPLTAGAATSSHHEPPSPPKPRRLSEDELQQRIAVMKGEASPRAPTPPRPSPRKLPLGPPKAADDPITGSKYGTYYGGHQVRDTVKQYLDGDVGVGRTASTPSRRMEGIGYQMPARPRPAAKPAAKAAANQPVPQAALPQPSPPTALQVALAGEPFQDVDASAGLATQAAAPLMPPTAFLSGTELEKSPEKRGRPVPVVKPGLGMPMHAALAQPMERSGGQAAPAPRPVPVVKPQKRTTIGDMLRASRVDGYEEAASLAPSGANGGSGYGGGFAAAPQPAPSVPVAPAARSFPVQTGSPYSNNGSAGAGSLQQGGPGTPAVEYSADGSVVLSSKPIKLVKPAHLLHKTHGFEDAMVEQGPGAQGRLAGQEDGVGAF